MRLDSVRELKQQVLDGTIAVPPTVSLEAGRPVPARGLVGVAPGQGADDWRLAVRLTEEDAALDAWVATVAEQARSEVDVRVVGPITALATSPADLQRRVRPLHRGLSLAVTGVTAGTLGAFVTREGVERRCVLSNSHVLADSGQAEPGAVALQPGPADGGGADDRVGELLVDVPLSRSRPNLADAALALLDEGVGTDPSGGDGALAGVVDAVDAVDLSQGVQKIGRTTGVTTGRITAIEVDAVPVGYDIGVLTFDDQVEIEGDDVPFSAGGDSGSVICTRSGRLALGLLFAGSSAGGPSGTGLTYANPLPVVLSLLEASLVLE